MTNKKQYSKDWREQNKDSVTKYNKEYRKLHRNDLLSYAKNWRKNNIELRKVSNYKHADKKKGLVCNLTVAWIKEYITSKSCIYCGETKDLGCDRLDNTKGHTKDNCIPCCNDCNMTRGNRYSVDEMKYLGIFIKEIKNKRKQDTNGPYYPS